MDKVAPLAGARIEIVGKILEDARKRSLPSRERGLKCLWALSLVTRLTVAPLAGAWIEIAYKLLGYKNVYVALLAGARIEMHGRWG